MCSPSHSEGFFQAGDTCPRLHDHQTLWIVTASHLLHKLKVLPFMHYHQECFISILVGFMSNTTSEWEMPKDLPLECWYQYCLSNGIATSKIQTLKPWTHRTVVPIVPMCEKWWQFWDYPPLLGKSGIEYTEWSWTAKRLCRHKSQDWHCESYEYRWWQMSPQCKGQDLGMQHLGDDQAVCEVPAVAS